MGTALAQTPVNPLRGSPGFHPARSDRTSPSQHSRNAEAEADSGAPLKRTSCPQYSVPQAELRGRVLSLSVWHHESLGRNIFLGEVEVPLDTWEWNSGAIWLPLQPRVRQLACVEGPATQFVLLHPTGPSPSPPQTSLWQSLSLAFQSYDQVQKSGPRWLVSWGYLYSPGLSLETSPHRPQPPANHVPTVSGDSTPLWFLSLRICPCPLTALLSQVPPSPDDLPSRGQLSLSLKYVPAGSEGE